GALGGYGSGLAPSALSPFSSTEWFIRGTEPARADDWFVAGCPAPDGTAKVSMSIKDTRGAAFQKYTDQWVRDAMTGKYAYGRYTWNLVGPDPCPTPSASPTPTLTPVPTRTPGPTPTTTFPIGTLPPFPTPKKTP
ncbi:MAG TPA: hypothetical protein VIN63_01695, partial [Candidatus Limnocylindria bacterium]